MFLTPGIKLFFLNSLVLADDFSDMNYDDHDKDDDYDSYNFCCRYCKMMIMMIKMMIMLICSHANAGVEVAA